MRKLAQLFINVLPMLFIAFGLFGVNEAAWGKEWKWQITVGVSEGRGTVYAKIEQQVAIWFDENTSEDATYGNSKTVTVTTNKIWATSNSNRRGKVYLKSVDDGYSFDGWYNTSGAKLGSGNECNAFSSTNSGANVTINAKFTPVTVSSAGTASTSFNHPETKTVTLYFPVSNNADANADFNAPTIEANTGWSISSWSLNTSTHKVEVVCSYTASSDISKGAHSAKVTLTSKANKSNTGTVTANVDLTPTLTFDNGSVDVSVSDADKTTLDVATLLTAYKGADNVAGDGAITYALKTANSNVSLTSAGIFYAKALGTYTIVATAAKGRYYAKTAEFNVTVNKRTPTLQWNKTGENDHIYSGDTLVNLAYASYGNNTFNLPFEYSVSPAGVLIPTAKKDSLIANPELTQEAACTVTASFAGNETYCAINGTHPYNIEAKITPLFKLGEEDLPESPVKELKLKVGETANMTFVGTDESNNRFTYPTNAQYVSYTHNSVAHTGVITGTVAGDEVIQFHQTSTTTIFDHTRSIHVYVSKHPVNLSTTLDGGTWKVDSVYDGAVYSIVTTTGDQPALSEVSVISSNEAVLKKVDGHWKAVGEGEATLTITHPSTNAYWAGQTVTATITVVKHTPVITWNLESSYAWGAQISNPVSSTCELPFTLTSSDPTKADYVNGKIEVYNKNGNVTFTLTQEGNYKWNDASSNLSYTFNCFKPANHVPMDLKAGNYSHYKSYVTDNVSWNNSGVQCGTAGGGFNWDDKYIELHVTGVPYHLTFNYQTNNNVVGNNSGVEWFVQYKTETGDWSDKTTWKDNSGSKDFTLNPDVQYVRLCYSGNYGGLFTNVNITERKEIVAPASVTFPTNSVDASANTQTINVNWYNVKHSTVTITGTNASFFSLADDSHEIASAIDDYGTKTLKVAYAYPEGGTHTATLHIESEDGYSANVALEATSTKLTPSIQWKENLSPMSRGENVLNAASAPVALTFSSSNESVVKVVGDTLKPLAKGTATITASFDGTPDKKWNSVSDTYDVLVTDMKVLHINWPQTFTRLKYAEGDADKTTADFELVATVSYFDPDTKEEISIDRTVTFTSSDNAVVQVLPGNILHVAGLGTAATLTAHVDGVENEFIEANVVRTVKVREPSTDCDTYILEDAHNSMLTEINSFNGVETVYELTEEPGYLTFSAWTEKWYLGKIGIDPAGDMKVAQYIDGEWSKAIWSNGLQIGVEQTFGPIELDRRATKIKFYKEVGSTCYHNFSEGYVTLARYVELENTPKKTTLDLYFSTSDAKPGVPAVKTFTVNYSNITDQLVLDYEGSEKFTVLSPSSIGEECGDKGTATVQVQFLSHDVDHYEGTLTIHNTNQSVTIHLSADVDKHHQQIEWNPETLNLKTTDNVTFDATTTGSAANLSVTYAVTAGNAATVNAATGELTIVTEGEVTIEARAAGNASYYDAEPVSKTFSISKVTPTITTVPTAATMTLPNTNLSGCGLAGGVASVDGTFAWEDNTINATLNNAGYTVIFTPENTNWYSTNSCIVVVPVNKTAQAIVWDFDQLEMFCNAQVTFDAHSNSGLAELPVSYSSSDESIAYVDGNNHLNIIKGGKVTITATQGGNAIYAAAEPVSKTLTINRFAPTIVTLPNASTMKIGRSLSDASLTGGLAELDGLEVEGSFAWVDGNTTVMDVAGTFSKQVVFTPANTNYYEPVYDQKSVTVEKYAPEIAQSLHGSDITYGQALSVSNLTGTLTATDIIKIPSVEVEGTFAWLQPSAVLNAGSQSATVRFTPANMDWYEVVDFPVQLNVNKASTEGLTVTGVSEIFYGQVLGEAVLENTTVDPIHGGVVAGTMVWNASLNLDEYMEVGSHNLSVTFTVNDPNYIYATLDGTAVLTVQAGYVFNGNDGQSKTWGEDTNWQGNEAPDGNEKVVILADVDIDSPVSVDAITIKEGVTVRVKEGAVLTIGNSDSFVRSSYGNLYVENGGQVIFGEGEVQVHDFTLEAKLGDADNLGMSGQVSNPATLKVRGNAYFDLALDPSGECSPGWYDFTVPFPVDALNGVTRFDNTTHMEKTIKNEKNYAIMDFSESRRLETGYGWKKYRSVMQPGQCYTITIDDVDNVYRFKMVKDGSFNNQTIAPLAYTDVEDNHRGWNGLGNGTLSYINLSAANIEKVQVYSHATRAYTAVPMDTFTYVVGSAYFVQAPSINSVMNYTQGGDTHVLRAPKREAVGVSEFTLTLTKENAASADDRFYVSAIEDAMDSYTIGRELTKFGAPTDSKVAQIWTEAYGMKLCDIEMQLVNEEANCALSLFAPNAGSYELKIERAPEDAALYLTYNDNVIWDLTSSPYVFDLSKGTTTGYGLRIEARGPQIATGVDNANAEGQAMRKVIIDNKVYIITPEGKMYDIMGKSVKY